MNILKYKDYEGTAEVDMEQQTLRGRILFIDDLVTYKAGTPALLKQEFESAVDDYLQTCADLGREPRKPLKGLFNVRVTPELHRAAVLRSLQESVSLNEVVGRALRSYLDQPLTTVTQNVGQGNVIIQTKPVRTSSVKLVKVAANPGGRRKASASRKLVARKG